MGIITPFMFRRDTEQKVVSFFIGEKEVVGPEVVHQIADKSTIHRWESADPPRFPRRIHLSRKKVVWLKSEIDQWFAEKLEADRPGQSDADAS
jgi:predicted DNA-binding transcriptional regulator AlpA